MGSSPSRWFGTADVAMTSGFRVLATAPGTSSMPPATETALVKCARNKALLARLRMAGIAGCPWANIIIILSGRLMHI
jgi:hypothetical protein